MFGEQGIWNAHKKVYERSVLRSSFIALSAAWLLSLLVVLLAFLVKS
jgi:hypothetical protein